MKCRRARRAKRDGAGEFEQLCARSGSTGKSRGPIGEVPRPGARQRTGPGGPICRDVVCIWRIQEWPLRVLLTARFDSTELRTCMYILDFNPVGIV